MRLDSFRGVFKLENDLTRSPYAAPRRLTIFFLGRKARVDGKDFSGMNAQFVQLAAFFSAIALRRPTTIKRNSRVINYGKLVENVTL
jgi:hypothetical protein